VDRARGTKPDVVGDRHFGSVSLDGRVPMNKVLTSCRFVNLGFRGRHLCTPDPAVSAILPVDEESWNHGVSPSRQNTYASNVN
jgi:hypothetical protein